MLRPCTVPAAYLAVVAATHGMPWNTAATAHSREVQIGALCTGTSRCVQSDAAVHMHEPPLAAGPREQGSQCIRCGRVLQGTAQGRESMALGGLTGVLGRDARQVGAP